MARVEGGEWWSWQRAALAVCFLFVGMSARRAETRGVVVKFRDSESVQRREVQTRDGANRTVVTVAGLDLDVVFDSKFVSGLISAEGVEDVEESLEQLRADGNVEYAEPDIPFFIRPPSEPAMGKPQSNTGLANDIHFTNSESELDLWNLNASGVPQAWTLLGKGSRDIRVLVIDTGIDYAHPDLAANMWTNPFDPIDGIDNDGNGFVDDYHGANALTAPEDPMSGDPNDDHGHGTHCAGTIGAVENGVHVVGVSPQVSLMACKAFDSLGDSTLETILRCLEWAMTLPESQRPHIISNSYGSYNHSAIFENVVLPEIQRNNILFVVAAGNDAFNNDDSTTASYPASYDSDIVLSVGASNEFSEITYFSNFGYHTVDLAAPGTNINSTAPFSIFESYTRTESGTSMSTPLVAGAAALLLSAYPSTSALQLKEALLQGADTVLPTNGWYLRSVTSGLVNVTRSAKFLDDPWTVVPFPAPFEAPAVVIAHNGSELNSAVFPKQNSSMLFTWDGSTYQNCSLPLSVNLETGEHELPVDTSEMGEEVSLHDDGSQLSFILPPVRFFGRNYTEFFIGANGFITFRSSSGAFIPTLENHYSLPRISGLFADLTPDPPVSRIEFLRVLPSAEEVPYPLCLLGSGGVVITYRNIRHYMDSTPNDDSIPRSTFQILISYEGNVMLAWKDIYMVTDAVVGLSDGVGMPDRGYSLDASPECGPLCPRGNGTAYDAPAVLVDPTMGGSGGGPAPFPLKNSALLFTWRRGIGGYGNCSLALPVDELTGEAELPFDTAETGARLLLTDDDSAQIPLSRPVLFFGRNYSSIHVGANGYVTFAAGSSDSVPTLEAHYSLPRVSGLFLDLVPNNASLSSIEFAQVTHAAPPGEGDQLPYPFCALGTGGVVVTYRNVPHAEQWPSDSPSTSTFQIFVSYQGNVLLSWGDVTLNYSTSVVGLSDAVMMAERDFNLDGVQQCDGVCPRRTPYQAPAMSFQPFTSSNSTFPLEGRALTYAWNGDGYDNCTTALSLGVDGKAMLPVDTDVAEATVLSIGDEDSREIQLSRMLTFFGVDYASITIVSNGYVSLGSDSGIDWSGDLATHYSSPRVSALLTDLEPDEGSSVEVLEVAPGGSGNDAFATCPLLGVNGGVVITYRNIRHYRFATPDPEEDIPRSTFQIILSFDGTIVLAYGDMHLQRSVVVGISDGVAMTNDFSLAAVPICPEETCSLLRFSCGLWRVRYKLGVSPSAVDSAFHVYVVLPMVAHRIADAMGLPADSPRIELSKEWEREGQKPGCRQLGPIAMSQWDMWFNDLQEAMDFWKYIRRYGNVAKEVKSTSPHMCNVSHKPQAPRMRNKVCMESSVFQKRRPT